MVFVTRMGCCGVAQAINKRRWQREMGPLQADLSANLPLLVASPCWLPYRLTMQTNEILPPYHPNTVVRLWGNDAFRVSDAVAGVCVFGATGSGKTTGPGKHLAYGYLAAGFGGVVLCAKPEESHQWQEWAAKTGRSEDLVIIDAIGTWTFNVIEWECNRAGGGGISINVANLLDELVQAAAGSAETGGGSERFWNDATHLLNVHLIQLALLANVKITLPFLHSIITSAAYSPDQLADPAWKENSLCAATITEAEKITKEADADTRADFENTRDYWEKQFPQLSDKTRSVITLMFCMMAQPLVSSPLRKLFSSTTSVTPEATFEGKIIIVDLPVAHYRLVGRMANIIWKYSFQMAVLRRVQPADRKTFLRPVFLFADEAQNFISKGDAEYQAVARSAGGCTVYMTQNRESYKRVLKNDDAVDSLLGNLTTKIFCANAGETNEWASRLLGEHWVHITSTTAGQSNNLMSQQPFASHNAGVTRTEQKRKFIEEARFTTLKRGGPQYDFLVECVIYKGGHLFSNGWDAIPFKILSINQILTYMPYQNTNNSSMSQRNASAEWLTGLPALTLMVLTRKDIGYRLLRPVRLLLVTAILAIVAILAMPDSNNPGPGALLIFAVVVFASGMSQRIRGWRQLDQNIFDHSYYIGTSRLEWVIPWPQFMLRHRRVARYVEPLVWVALGILLMPIMALLGFWLLLAGLCLRVYEDSIFRRERNRDLDIADSVIISQRHAQVVRSQEAAAPLPEPPQEDFAAGIGPDILEQLKRQKQHNNTLKQKNNYEQTKINER